MKLYKGIKFRHVKKILEKSYQPDSVFMHHTGYMYGIGTSIDSDVGMKKISALKARNSAQGFVVLVSNIDKIIEAADEIDNRTIRLIEQYLPGNVTFVLKCSDPRFSKVARDGTVAFRVPQNPVLCHFIEQMGSPMVSTSINLNGMTPETDLKKIIKNYDSWFDFGFTSHKVFQLADDQPSTIIKIDKDIECLREASVPYYEIKQSYDKSMILFVCTGNVCRSPIAEYLLKEKIDELQLPFRTASAGVLQDGMVISANSSALLLEAGIDASAHLSRKLTQDMIRDSWLILTMEERHKEFFAKNYPHYGRKVTTLLEFCGGQGDIEDPFQQSIDKYRTAFKIIKKNVNCLIDILKKEVNIDD